jgi:hypothetical protein
VQKLEHFLGLISEYFTLGFGCTEEESGSEQAYSRASPTELSRRSAHEVNLQTRIIVPPNDYCVASEA